jgi:ribosomal protein S21
MRRFSRKIQGAGVVKKVRSLRYYVKSPSDTQTKKDALTRIARTEKYRELFKQGREIPSKKKRR